VLTESQVRIYIVPLSYTNLELAILYKSKPLPVILCGCETWSCSKKEKSIEYVWGQSTEEKVCILKGNEIRIDENNYRQILDIIEGLSRRLQGESEVGMEVKYIYNFSGTSCSWQTTWKTSAK